MRTIRRNVFETNSSSTHSMVIGTKEQFETWEDGGLFVNWDGDFLTKELVSSNDVYLTNVLLSPSSYVSKFNVQFLHCLFYCVHPVFCLQFFIYVF